MYYKFEMLLGKMVVGIHSDGTIFGLWFEDQKHFPKIPQDAIWFEKKHESNKIKKTLNALETQLEKYFRGELEAFDLPLSPKGTDFQNRIWRILEAIKFGETTTYGEISDLVSKEMNKKSMSAQAVGNAVGRNPISIIIPCHRVLGSDGSLTGYAGGVDRKRTLLEIEGVVIEEQIKMDL